MEENDDEEEKHSEAEVLNIFLSSDCCSCCCCISFSFFKSELSRGVFADSIKLTWEPLMGSLPGNSLSSRLSHIADIVDKEVSVLARLTFHNNLLIGQVKSVRCPH